MAGKSRFSAQTLSVLAALEADPEGWLHGYLIAKQTGATLIKLPIMPGGVPDTDTYIKEMDYIVNTFAIALSK